MTRPRSLRHLLLASYGLVIAVVAAVGFVTVRTLTPELFKRRVRANGAGPPSDAGGRNPFADSTAVADALDRSLTLGAAVAAATGIVVAVAVAWIVVRLLLRRVADMQRATHRLAAGDHRARVPLPPETELAELAGSINTLGDTLAATAATRARLISDLAHELRNPLTTIQGSMEGLLDGVIEPSPDTFASVAEETERLRRLTDDLSLLARGQEGALDLRPKHLDLRTIVADTVATLGPAAEAKGVTLATTGDRVCPVEVDADRMTQVLMNIIANALTHTPAAGRIDVSCQPVEGRIRLSVADTGAGIPPDQLDIVFDRYTRLDHQRPGTGIGLNIARTIVVAHGGSITAHSSGPGTGATFVVDLPVA